MVDGTHWTTGKWLVMHPCFPDYCSMHYKGKGRGWGALIENKACMTSVASGPFDNMVVKIFIHSDINASVYI